MVNATVVLTLSLIVRNHQESVELKMEIFYSRIVIQAEIYFCQLYRDVAKGKHAINHYYCKIQ